MESAVPDVLAPGLRVVFCGINPGRVSAAAGAHFANPRNDFWRLLHAAGLTPRVLDPSEQFSVLEHGIGLTNAAYRTTKGSGDLRSADFAGSAERLARLALELRPAWLAFVGKEAYRGAFGERPELGLQERRLGETELFVLPSTSPANAAVPWAERHRWFQELAGRATGLPLRPAVRAVVIDPDDRTVLMRYVDDVWAVPGGGIDPGEADEEVLARELAEELGLDDYALGPCVWWREHWFPELGEKWGGQAERIYLVRSGRFEPSPRLDLTAENVVEVRWWTLDELLASDAEFAPRRLAILLRDLLAAGPPAEPEDVGV
ncbi:MAG: NUDIX domain-containing protein [Gaiellaceae bacterium]